MALISTFTLKVSMLGLLKDGFLRSEGLSCREVADGDKRPSVLVRDSFVDDLDPVLFDVFTRNRRRRSSSVRNTSTTSVRLDEVGASASPALSALENRRARRCSPRALLEVSIRSCCWMVLPTRSLSNDIASAKLSLDT